MRNLLTALLCLSLTGLAGAQGSTSSTSAQQTNTEKTAQGTAAQPKEPTAIIETTAGNITCTLFPEQAPLTVANFIGLATGTKAWKNPKTGEMMHGVPLYNGTIFHRVIPNFMIQGGDPIGTGSGDPGYSFKDEFSSDLTFDQPGRLAMANSGPNTNGSQFFITEVPTPHLNGKHTIFGQCQDLDVVKKIARMSSDPRNDRPFDPPKITRIKIIDPRHPAAKPATPAHKPAAAKPATPPSQ
jgi:peptidyl-prolyl cis-trans isomerase A (cyclophilin A)